MSMNGISSTSQTTGMYNDYNTAVVDKTALDETQEVAESGVVYEKTSEGATQKPATYTINQMSKEDREALVKQLKEDQQAREESLLKLVNEMFTKQAEKNTFAMDITEDDDSIWKFIASGEYTVDEATKKQAQEDIAEDGYWGVKQTSQRLFDFASALAGDDVDKMKEMQEAMEKGFQQATKSWGKDLPQISQDTLEAANKLFEDYYASKNQTTDVTA